MQDLRLAVRLMLKDRRFTLVAVVALGLGIAVNITVFALVDAVLIRSLPFHDPDQIVSLGTRDARGRDLPIVSFSEFEDWRAATKSFSGLAVFTGAGGMNLSGDGAAPERFPGAYISANTFRLLGVQPLVGHDFNITDDHSNTPSAVILGFGVWKSRYGGDPSVVGRTIKLNDRFVTVIGVMPEGMRFPLNAEIWVILGQWLPGLRERPRSVRNLQPFGRLADGVTITQARAELVSVAAALSREYPTTNKDVVPSVVTFRDRYTPVELKQISLALMAAAGFLLLIACLNVANLLLARSAYRAREIGLRVSLGATRWRIVRQLLLESATLGLASGILGLALSLVGVGFLERVYQELALPYFWIRFSVDARVFLFFAATCFGTVILFGLTPALHVSSEARVNAALKEGVQSAIGGVRARRWTSILIVAELALTTVLLACAGLMVRSFLALYRMNSNIDASHVLTMSVALPPLKYPRPEQYIAFYRLVEERFTAISVVQSVAIASHAPMEGGLTRRLRIERRSWPTGEQSPNVTMVSIGPGYFRTLALPLVRGRAFADIDGTPGHESAVVNRQFAAVYFPNEDPIGRRIQLTDELTKGLTPSWMTIIGIVPDVRQRDIQAIAPDPVVYLPHNIEPSRFNLLMVRSESDPSQLSMLLREAVTSLDPDLPLYDIKTMDARLAQSRGIWRVFGTMFAVFALIALVLSAVGVYGVTAHSVRQRTREIGLRMALGASPENLMGLIGRGVSTQVVIGLVLGMAATLAVGKLLKSMLVQTSSIDPVTMLSIGALLLVVALGACFFPARRATRLDPVVALRYE